MASSYKLTAAADEVVEPAAAARDLVTVESEITDLNAELALLQTDIEGKEAAKAQYLNVLKSSVSAEQPVRAFDAISPTDGSSLVVVVVREEGGASVYKIPLETS